MARRGFVYPDGTGSALPEDSTMTTADGRVWTAARINSFNKAPKVSEKERAETGKGAVLSGVTSASSKEGRKFTAFKAAQKTYGPKQTKTQKKNLDRLTKDLFFEKYSRELTQTVRFKEAFKSYDRQIRADKAEKKKKILRVAVKSEAKSIAARSARAKETREASNFAVVKPKKAKNQAPETRVGGKTRKPRKAVKVQVPF